jgi:cytochrome oxidase Cu insertion factor (SCO1/SenC/PrrC family)
MLRDYARRLGFKEPGWALLTGTPEEIVAVGKRFQLAFKQQPGRDIDHTAAVYLLDRDLAVRDVYPVATLSSRRMLHDIAYLLGTHR